MFYRTKEKIQTALRLSEVITVNEEATTPLYKVRENIAKADIAEKHLREYLLCYCNYNHPDIEYINQVLDKIYRPTVADLQDRNEILKLSSLR